MLAGALDKVPSMISGQPQKQAIPSALVTIRLASLSGGFP